RASDLNPRLRCSPPAALLARGDLRRGSCGGCLPSPTPPEADVLRLTAWCDSTALFVLGFLGLRRASDLNPRLRCSPPAALLARGNLRLCSCGGCLPSPTPPEANGLRNDGLVRFDGIVRRGFPGSSACIGPEPSLAVLASGCAPR